MISKINSSCLLIFKTVAPKINIFSLT